MRDDLVFESESRLELGSISLHVPLTFRLELGLACISHTDLGLVITCLLLSVLPFSQHGLDGPASARDGSCPSHDRALAIQLPHASHPCDRAYRSLTPRHGRARVSIQGTTGDADPLLWTGVCTTADPLARRAERTTVRVGLLDGMPAEVIGSPSQGILFAASALTRMCACKSWMSESGVGRMHGMWMGSQVKECQTSRMHAPIPLKCIASLTLSPPQSCAKDPSRALTQITPRNASYDIELSPRIAATTVPGLMTEGVCPGDLRIDVSKHKHVPAITISASAHTHVCHVLQSCSRWC